MDNNNTNNNGSSSNLVTHDVLERSNMAYSTVPRVDGMIATPQQYPCQFVFFHQRYDHTVLLVRQRESFCSVGGHSPRKALQGQILAHWLPPRCEVYALVVVVVLRTKAVPSNFRWGQKVGVSLGRQISPYTVLVSEDTETKKVIMSSKVRTIDKNATTRLKMNKTQTV